MFFPESSPVGNEDPSASSGSVLLLGAIWTFTKMWFPPNILTHVVSCIRTTKRPHPALDHLIQIPDAHWRITQLTQRGELDRTAGGGEQMEINQRSAHFASSALHGKGRTYGCKKGKHINKPMFCKICLYSEKQALGRK